MFKKYLYRIVLPVSLFHSLTLRGWVLRLKGCKFCQDGWRVFANRRHRSTCFPFEVHEQLVVCQFITVEAWTIRGKTLVWGWGGGVRGSNQFVFLLWRISLMTLNILLFSSLDIPDLSLSLSYTHSRGSSPTPRPPDMLDSPTCQIRFIASLWKKDSSSHWWL